MCVCGTGGETFFSVQPKGLQKRMLWVVQSENWKSNLWKCKKSEKHCYVSTYFAAYATKLAES